VNRAGGTEQKPDAKRDALFEEFLRWRESQKITGPANPR
jgi:hypothetical protein